MRLGIPPASAAEQAQKQQLSRQRFQALPDPTGPAPYRIASSQLGIPPAQGKRVLHVIGDSGGVKDPHPQLAVADALVADLQAHPEVGFLYHVGDVDYFNGEQKEYPAQFFEPYAKYLRHILPIPGNHDGDALPGEASLGAFVRYFCDPHGPQLLPEVEEYHTDTLALPNVYWTLRDDAVTIVGLYSNVPSGGVIKADQADWLAGELGEAPAAKPVIVAVHHPPFSCDAHHGGSQHIWQVIVNAASRAGRAPDAILAGHVHNYQRFSHLGVPILVCGAGGYHHLHGMARGAHRGQTVAKDVKLEAWDDKHFGFLRLAIEGKRISGEYVVAQPGRVPAAVDAF